MCKYHKVLGSKYERKSELHEREQVQCVLLATARTELRSLQSRVGVTPARDPSP